MAEVVRKSFRRRPKAERMAEIELAARQAFSTKGYNATSMAQIAEDAGISEGTIYKFYENKRDLLLVILLRWFEDVRNAHQLDLQKISGTRARVRAIIHRHLSAVIADPDLARLLFAEIRDFEYYRETELYQISRQYTRVLIDVLKEGIALGEVRPDTRLTLVRDVIFGGIEHHISSFLSGYSDIDLNAVSDDLCDLVMVGIAVPAAPPPDIEAVVDRLERVADRLEAGKPDGGGG